MRASQSRSEDGKARALADSVSAGRGFAPKARAGPRAVLGLILCSPLLSLLPHGAGASAAAFNVTPLRPGDSVERDILRRQTHSFSVALAAGEYAEAVVEQRGVDLVVGVFNPDRAPLDRFDSPVGLTGRELVSVMATAAGQYRLDVYPSEDWAAPGSYKISVVAVRPPTPADEKRYAAERAYAEGRRLSVKEATRGAAIQKYMDAYRLWEEAAALSGAGGAPRYGQANALHSLGLAYGQQRDIKNAAEHYEHAYRLRLEIGDRAGAAYTLSDMAAAHRELGSKQKALEYYGEALRLFQETGNRRGEASAYHGIGFIHFLKGDMDEALRFYELALPIRRAEKDLRGEARTLNVMAGVYNARGENEKVDELVRQAARSFKELGDRRMEALTKNNAGKIHDDRGEWQQALNNYEEALSIYRELPEPEREQNLTTEAYTIDNIGLIYADPLNQPERALERLREALAIREQGRDPGGLGATKGRIGFAYFRQGDLETALQFYLAALACNEKADDGERQAETLTVIGMAHVAYGQRATRQETTAPGSSVQKVAQNMEVQAAVCGGTGEALALAKGPGASSAGYKKALGYYERALQFQGENRNRQGRAITLDKMGDVYALLGDPQKGMEHYRAALRLWQLIKDRNGEAITLYNMARVERNRGDLLEARKWIAAALDIVESLRTNVVSQQSRISYFASRHNYYELDVDVKMRLHRSYPSAGYEAAALQSSERARARALLDLLSEANADIREGVAPELLQREKVLARRLNEKAASQTQMLSAPHTNADADALAKEITRLTDEYADVQARIRAQSPGYAALTQPQPLTLKGIQQLLDADTLLLEFALGEEKSYVWLVSDRAIEGHELPRRDMIEKAAGDLYKSLTALQLLPGDITAKGDITPERRARVTKAAAQYPGQAKSLSGMLLGKVADKLENKRLLIVADGVLQYIPFAALPSPSSPQSAAGNARAGNPPGAAEEAPLILEHEIAALPSATTLAALRSRTEKRQSAPGAVAVLADPVFHRDDERLRVSKKGPARAGADSSEGRSSAKTDENLLRAGFHLRRLPLTAQEAQAIRKAAAPQDVMIAVDFEASRDTLMSPKLRQYRIVHFATHGVLDNVHPELSGIVLSQVDEAGRAQDGMLRLHDIYNLRLPAELAVLSACDTGLGKTIKGEGLVGLTRGFMYAGVPRVVASLWKVEDYPTALLMEKFYAHLFKTKLSPAAALRQSQIEMMRQERWREPFYWAAFMLHGEVSNMP